MTDTRFAYQRIQRTETECDCCEELILESERRYERDDEVLCEACEIAATPDPENIYGLASMRQSIEEDRK